MAVVPMQKVHILVHRTDCDAVLNVLQQAGAMEFTEVEHEQTQAVVGEFRHAQLLPHVQHAIGFLSPYEVKRSLWRTLRDGSEVLLTEADVTKQLTNTDAIKSIVSDLEAIQVEFAEKNEEVRRLE